MTKRAAAHIQGRKRDLLAGEQTLANPQDIAGHHQLRIGAKRLRYTMEICDLAYDKQLGGAIQAVKKVQTLLGDIHDCDVWAECAEAFMEQERLRTIEYFGHHGPFNRLKPGLQLLIDERRQRRDEIFMYLVAYWETLSTNHLWGHLDAVLQSCAEGSRRPETKTEEVPSHGPEEDTDEDRPN